VANAGEEIGNGIRHAHVVLQWFQPLPAGLSETRNFAAHGRFAQLGTTQSALAVVTARPSRDLAAVAQADLARVARQRLQRRNGSLALRLAGGRLADDFFQACALRCVALHQLRSLDLAIDHRCLGHTFALSPLRRFSSVYLRNGKLKASSSARPALSSFAVVVIVMSMPRIASIWS